MKCSLITRSCAVSFNGHEVVQWLKHQTQEHLQVLFQSQVGFIVIIGRYGSLC